MITRNRLVLALIVCMFAGSAEGERAEDRESPNSSTRDTLTEKILVLRREQMFISLSERQQETVTKLAQDNPTEFAELLSGSPDAAAAALGDLIARNTEDAEVLINWALKHPHWKVRFAALRRAGLLEEPSKALIDSMRARLKHRDPYSPHEMMTSEDDYSHTEFDLANKIVRAESRVALMTLVSWRDEEALPFLLDKLIGQGRKEYWFEDSYELITHILQLSDKRTIPTLMNHLEEKASLWSTQRSGGPEITITVGDMAIFLIVRLTRQNIYSYFFGVPGRTDFYDFDEDREYCPGFADEEARQKSIKKLRQWWKDKQEEYAGVETLQLNIPQPKKRQAWEEPRGPKGSIKGHVYGPQGNAVPNALVTIIPWGFSFVKADSRGAFTIERSVGDWQHKPMRLIACDRTAQRAAIVEVTKETQEVDLKLSPAVELSGLTVDPSGKPIPDARVGIWLRGGTYSAELQGLSSKSNEEGRYILSRVPRGQEYYVRTTHNEYGEGYRRISVPQEAEGTISLEPIEMAIADVSISGIVVDGDGQPVGSAIVSCGGRGQPSRSVITDDQGRFTLPRVCKGAIVVTAYDLDTGSSIAKAKTTAPSKDLKLVKRPEKTR